MPVIDPANFTKQGAGDDTPIPPGDYLVTVKEAELRDGNKAPYYSIRLQVVDGPCKGRVVFDIVSTSENSRWKWADFVHSFRYTKPFDPIEGFDQMRKAAMAHPGFWVELGPEKNPSPGDEERVRVLRFLWKKDVPSVATEIDDEIPF